MPPAHAGVQDFLCRCPAAKNEKTAQKWAVHHKRLFLWPLECLRPGPHCALWWPVQAASSFFSSPDWYISIMMSEPPINSPFTYSWGMVGHWL